MRRNPLLYVLLFASLGPRPCVAITLVVPDAFATVGAALGAAVASDTVLVRSGTYPERVTMVDGVVLLGEQSPTRPVLDGESGGAVLTVSNCGASTRIVNLVLTQGAGGTFGGGATLQDADVVFEGCDFTDNAAVNGAGVGATNSDFTLLDCSFHANVASQSGGAIAMSGPASPWIQGCAMHDNSAVAGGAVVILNGSLPSFSGCLMQGNSANQGAALWWDFFTGGSAQSCTIVENTCLSASSGAVHLSPFASPTITETIIAFTSGAAATFNTGGATPTWGCNDAFGNTGGDVFAGGVDLGTNLFLDPVFCNAAAGTWTLADASPCLAGGSCPRRGAFDLGCITVSAPEPLAGVSWGRAKSSFR